MCVYYTITLPESPLWFSNMFEYMGYIFGGCARLFRCCGRLLSCCCNLVVHGTPACGNDCPVALSRLSILWWCSDDALDGALDADRPPGTLAGLPESHRPRLRTNISTVLSTRTAATVACNIYILACTGYALLWIVPCAFYPTSCHVRVDFVPMACLLLYLTPLLPVYRYLVCYVTLFGMLCSCIFVFFSRWAHRKTKGCRGPLARLCCRTSTRYGPSSSYREIWSRWGVWPWHCCPSHTLILSVFYCTR